MTSQQKPVVMIFIDWYIPGYKAGGPIRTCVNMVSHLRGVFDFRIVTRDTDLGESEPYKDTTSNEWVSMDDGSKVYYISKDNLSYGTIGKLIDEVRPDTVHINSMFSRFFTIVPLRYIKRNSLDIHVVMGPRGMLSKGALAIKPVKKQLFLLYAKMTGLFKDVTWHASTDVEAAEIIDTFGDVKVMTAIDLAPQAPERIRHRKKEAGKLSLYFLGRISEVKNLSGCLELLTELDLNKDQSIDYHIYGPVEDEVYWSKCSELIGKLPANITCHMKGAIVSEKIPELISGHHCLFMLTRNENYGHAIVEGMVHGCPVIISDRTPWRDLDSKKAGWDLDLSDQTYAKGILHRLLQMEQTEFDTLSSSAASYGRSVVNDPDSIESNRVLLTKTR